MVDFLFNGFHKNFYDLHEKLIRKMLIFVLVLHKTNIGLHAGRRFSNECSQSMFWVKHKENWYTHVYPRFSVQKWGMRGIHSMGGPRGRVVKVADFSALNHSIISPLWVRASLGARVTCGTSQVLLAGVSGGFSPGTPVFAPPTD